MAKNTFRKSTQKKETTSKRSLIPSFFLDQKFIITTGFVLIGLSLFLFFSFLSHIFSGKADQGCVEIFYNQGCKNILNFHVNNKIGMIGALCGYFFVFRWFGVAAFFIPLFIYLLGHKAVYKKTPVNILKGFNICLFFITWLNILFGYFKSLFPKAEFLENLVGGAGIEIVELLRQYIGGGVLILIFVFFVIFAIYLFNINSVSLPNIKHLAKKKHWTNDKLNNKSDIINDNNDISDNIQKNKTNVSDPNENNINTNQEEQSDGISLPNEPDDQLTLTINDTKDEAVNNEQNDENDIESNPTEPTTEQTKIINQENYDPTLDLASYKYPTIDLLKQHDIGKVKIYKDELEQNKIKIVDTLTNFKIGIASIKATIGPTVTLYEIVPKAGVKISKIKNLEDDIALNLSALGIRIIAPIPGKGTIGIEVPNKNRETVPFKSIVRSEKFMNGKMDLPVILGKTISNEVFIADLRQMPHLLIAGATGQGKSVGLNVVLSSLLYKKHPSQLKLVLVDPKKVELSLYSKTEKHFLAKLPSSGEPIITATKEVVHTLNSLCIEMDTRYELLKDAGTRNIKEYNQKFVSRKLNPKQGHRFLPYIVLVIDEFADMMMTAGKEIETPVARLAQLARAIGIHLVLATQRPSVNVITGTIKANFPVRLSYKVSSKIDSRTILDASGADQLVGRGDLLLSMNSEVIRLQCPFIDTQEVEDICKYIGSQQGYTSAYSLPEYESDNENNAYNKKELQERDSMFEEAARLIVSHQQGSTSLIQRRLKLGYNRAGRLIDQLEAAGIVGPFEGSKARSVLVPDESSLEMLLNEMVN